MNSTDNRVVDKKPNCNKILISWRILSNAHTKVNFQFPLIHQLSRKVEAIFDWKPQIDWCIELTKHHSER